MRFFGLSVSAMVIALPVGAQIQAPRFKQMSPQQAAANEAKCRQTAARMLTSTNAEVQIAEMNVAVSCPDSGAALLAARWRVPPSDSSSLYVLTGASRWMIDARLAESALSVVQNRGERLHVRVRALEAVMGQYGVWVTFGPMDKARTISPSTGAVEKEWDIVRTSFRSNSSYESTRGKAEMTEQLKQRISASLRELARGPDDPYMLLALKEAVGIVSPAK